MSSKRSFKTLMEVLQFVRDSGYSLGQSTIYRDKAKGLIVQDENGRYTEEEARAYIRRAGLKPAVGGAEITYNADRKARAEIRKIEAQAAAHEFDLKVKQGRYVLKEDSVRERIDQAMILIMYFRQLLSVRLPEWLESHRGGLSVNEIRDIASLDIDEMLNSLATSDTFQIRYEDNGTEDSG